MPAELRKGVEVGKSARLTNNPRVSGRGTIVTLVGVDQHDTRPCIIEGGKHRPWRVPADHLCPVDCEDCAKESV